MTEALPTIAQADALAELNHKIDALTAQVAYLSDQARAAERAREERSELMHDAQPILNDVMRLATEQFQDVEAYVSPEDLLRVLKKLLRHGPQIEQLIDQLDTVMGLLEVAGPISREAFNKAETVLDGMDRKGYFAFARGGAQIADNIITSFTEDDVRRLGDNIVLILNTVKDMTQPEILGLVRAIVAQSEVEVTKPVNTSLPALLGQMRDPNVRRGLALTMRILAVVGRQGGAKA